VAGKVTHYVKGKGKRKKGNAPPDVHLLHRVKQILHPLGLPFLLDDVVLVYIYFKSKLN